MNELALFAGAGGGILGGHLLGWRTICAVEWEPYAACVLAARQNDGILPPFPIWDDVQTFDGKPWAGRVDVVSGGFPCQDISAAGKGAGIDGERSGMWSHMARIVGEVRPRYVYVENSPMLTSRGLHRVLGDLASLGFDARWGVVSAADVGALHQRDRIWIVAHANTNNQSGSTESRQQQQRPTQFERGCINRMETGNDLAYATQLQRNGGNDNAGIGMGRKSVSEFGNGGRSKTMADSDSTQREGNKRTKRSVEERTYIGKSSWWDVEPDVGRVAHGVAARVDRLKAIGNGQVPAVAATTFRLLGG
jgi:DNA (cytosine-5)-methyltransferase 1